MPKIARAIAFDLANGHIKSRQVDGQELPDAWRAGHARVHQAVAGQGMAMHPTNECPRFHRRARQLNKEHPCVSNMDVLVSALAPRVISSLMLSENKN